MNKEKFDEYIRTRYENQVDWYDKKSIFNKRFTYAFQIPILILATVTPIFIALDYSKITIIPSTIVAVGLAVLKFCKFEDLWHMYRTTCETLKKEKVHHDMLTDVYAKADNPDELFVERIESIISKEHTEWKETVSQTKKENNSDHGGL
jgi:hypothetical protein